MNDSQQEAWRSRLLNPAHHHARKTQSNPHAKVGGSVGGHPSPCNLWRRQPFLEVMKRRWRSKEGCSFPLGVSWVEEESAYNFALYSKHARSVMLLFYSPESLSEPQFRFEFDFLKNKSGPIWHCRIPRDALGEACYYAYRIAGPEPGPGFARHNFDADKLLLDPYARTIFFPPSFDRAAAVGPGSNEGRAPLSKLEDVRCDCLFDWDGDMPPRHDSDLVIYELHIRGFTRHTSSGIPVEKRGTFAGVIEKIPYLTKLGVTAVELMPVFQFDPQENNYWGYMPISFFAPHNAYSVDAQQCRQHDEFRAMVKALHAAGIEVILDVVYNHTGEGDHSGPIYSLKGIDNTSYYMITGDPGKPYANFSGTGNTLHTVNRAVRELIMDSLRYWVVEYHVDGFRFDLASVFTRNPDGSVSPEEPPIFGEIRSHSELADVRLIAEPWDAGGLYQLGRHFPGTLWMQWNGRYRETLQRFVRGDPGMVGDLMTRLYGSPDFFPDELSEACHPYQSVNYAAAHDGFTLYDLVSYNEKHNWANGHENTDGNGDFSWNCGWEGDGGASPETLRLRKQQVKNFFCLLMLSNGTPMFRMGDEFLNSQGGNNNPYNQDNETSWLDWNQRGAHSDVFRFFQMMIAFRSGHPSISRSRFWRGDIRWHGTGPGVDLTSGSRQLAYFLSGASQNDDDLYVMINAADGDAEFAIHEGVATDWRRVIDTANPSPDDILDPGDERGLRAPVCRVRARSVMVLIRRRSGKGPVALDPERDESTGSPPGEGCGCGSDGCVAGRSGGSGKIVS